MTAKNGSPGCPLCGGDGRLRRRLSNTRPGDARPPMPGLRNPAVARRPGDCRPRAAPEPTFSCQVCDTGPEPLSDVENDPDVY